MKLSLQLSALAVAHAVLGVAVPATQTGPQFENGQPIDGNGKGGPLLGVYTFELEGCWGSVN